MHQFIEEASHIFFAMMNTLMQLAPIGAGGAMAFTIGRYGVAALKPLAALMGSFYLTCVLFVVVVLGTIAALAGFNIFRFLAYIKDELLTVLGTSSSESALRAAHAQARAARDVRKSVVGLVVPSGLLVQPRRHEHLSDDGGDLRRAGAEHRADVDAAD